MNRNIVLCIMLLLYWATNAGAGDGITLSNDHITDLKEENRNRAFEDTMVRIDFKQIYGTWYLGNYQYGAEFGGYINDARRSSYSANLRFRSNDSTYWIGTDQVFKAGFVGKMSFRYIHVDELSPPDTKHDLFVYGFGFDKYYGDYNYFTAMYFNDPREAGHFSVSLSNTLSRKHSYLRLGLIPRSDGTLGYYGTVKYHWFFIGYAFTKEFDYTALDRRVTSFGVQMPFDLDWGSE